MIQQQIIRYTKEAAEIAGVSEGLRDTAAAEKLRGCANSDRLILSHGACYQHAVLDGGHALICTAPETMRRGVVAQVFYIPDGDLEAWYARSPFPQSAYFMNYDASSGKAASAEAFEADRFRDWDYARAAAGAVERLFPGGPLQLGRFIRLMNLYAAGGSRYRNICAVLPRGSEGAAYDVYCLMEYILRAFPTDMAARLGYAGIVTRVEEDEKYPVLFTCPGTQAARDKSRRYAILDLRGTDSNIPDDYGTNRAQSEYALAEALWDKDMDRLPELRKEFRREARELRAAVEASEGIDIEARLAEEARKLAAEEARRKAEEEARRLAAEEKAKKEAEKKEAAGAEKPVPAPAPEPEEEDPLEAYCAQLHEAAAKWLENDRPTGQVVYWEDSWYEAWERDGRSFSPQLQLKALAVELLRYEEEMPCLACAAGVLIRLHFARIARTADEDTKEVLEYLFDRPGFAEAMPNSFFRAELSVLTYYCQYFTTNSGADTALKDAETCEDLRADVYGAIRCLAPGMLRDLRSDLCRAADDLDRADLRASLAGKAYFHALSQECGSLLRGAGGDGLLAYAGRELLKARLTRQKQVTEYADRIRAVLHAQDKGAKRK